jgi:hypothetical protein
MKQCSTSLARKEMQIKTVLRFHLTSIRLAIKKTNVGEDGQVGGREVYIPPTYTVGGNVN